jgi:hypothetical protein
VLVPGPSLIQPRSGSRGRNRAEGPWK